MRQFYPNRFKDKVIALTDAARDIDEAIAIRATKEGAKLMPADRLKEERERILNVVRAGGGAVISLNLGLSAKEHAEQMADTVVKIYRHLGIAINNAGVMENPSPLHELEQEQMDHTMANNLYSVLFCCKCEIRELMREGNGDIIVNNASTAGLTGLPDSPVYVVSRHAVNGLIKNLTLDYVRYGIRVNPVNPAGTITPMVTETYECVKNHREAVIRASMDPAKTQPMAGQKLTSTLKREATAEEQVASILFLVSDDTTHTAGATV